MIIWLMRKLKLHPAMKRLNVSYKSQTQRSLHLWSFQPRSIKKFQIWRNKIKIPKTLMKVKSRLLMVFLTLTRLSNQSPRMIIQWSQQSMFSLKLKISRRKRLKICQTKRSRQIQVSSRKKKKMSNQRMLRLNMLTLSQRQLGRQRCRRYHRRLASLKMSDRHQSLWSLK